MTQLTEQQHREVDPQVSPSPAGRPSHASRAVAIVLLVLLVAGGFSVARRFTEKRALAVETEKLAVPTVAVLKPSTEPAQDELVLPAQLQAYVESPIYARTNGYVLHWYKDIGAHVKKGEILADIDTPEIDQELSQAKATRQQIQAQMEMAKISADRWTNLRKTDSVSQQEADQQSSAYTQARANMAAADANVRRLEQLESFKHVYAPFSGVVTNRNVDPGALISAGSTGKALFELARVDPLRVFAKVPQAYSAAIKVGMESFLVLQEFPGQRFSGTIARTADAIDPATRTLLTEVDVPNPDGRLLPGAYGELHFKVAVDAAKLTVPVNSMLFRQEGPRIAVVGPDNKVHLRAITIGRDYGSTLEVLEGVGVEDRIIINPADSLEEGQQVHISDEKAGADHS